MFYQNPWPCFRKCFASAKVNMEPPVDPGAVGSVGSSFRLLRAEGHPKRAEESPHFELLAPVRLNVVCFTLAGEAASTAGSVSPFLERERRDGRAFLTLTVYDRKPAIRLAVSKWRTTSADIDIAWDSLVRCAGGEGELAESI